MAGHGRRPHALHLETKAAIGVSELLSSAQAAARFGLAVGSFQNITKTLNLVHAELRGRAKFYAPADIDAALVARNEARQRAVRKTRTPEERTAADNAKYERALLVDSDAPPGSFERLSGDRDQLQLTDPEKSVVYAAHLGQTLGTNSPWFNSPPPRTYQRAYEAREAARVDAVGVAA